MTRRTLLSAPAAAMAAGGPARIAAIVTAYYRNSHADVFIGNMLRGFHWEGQRHKSELEIAAMYLEQAPANDIGRGEAARHGIPLKPTVRDAIVPGIRGVVLIGEHGDYPSNDKGQKLYPRYELMEKIVAAYRETGKPLPLFVDKHFSTEWTKAKRMFDWSRELKFPLMAGSSVSVTFRRPSLDVPLNADLESVVAVGGGWIGDGGLFHVLESMQALVERRKGGETGVKSVQLLQGDAVWKAANDGLWRRDLLDAALKAGAKVGKGRPEDEKRPVACLVEYSDGFRAASLALGGIVSEYLVALKRKSQPAPEAAICYIPGENSNNFSMLVHGITRMIATGKRPYAVERTLLTTGALAGE